MPLSLLREMPPTAGLPLRARDLGPAGPRGLAREAARFLGTETPLLTSSGSAALVIALAALAGLSARRKVVVPAFTCPLVPLAVLQAGLEPVVCDTALGSFELDRGRLALLLDRETLAVVPTHLAGRLADVSTVRELAEGVGAWVVEDAAQAFGPRQGGEPAGTLGDIGFHSLALGKGLTIFEGGLLHARNPALRRVLAETAARLARSDSTLEALRSLQLLGTSLLYRPSLLPFAYGRPLRRALRRGDLIGAAADRFDHRIPIHSVGRWRDAVGARAINRLGAHLERSAAVAERLRRRFEGLGGARILVDAPGDSGTWPALFFLMPDRASRDAVLARAWAGGIGAGRMFIHALPDYPDLRPVLPPAEVPNARDLAARSLTFGTSPWLGEAEEDAMAEALAGAARAEGAPHDEEAGADLVARSAFPPRER